MSGPDTSFELRRLRRGAALTLVFAGVLAAGAAGGAFGGDRAPGERAAAPVGSSPAAHKQDVQDVNEAAAEALADGKSAAEAARREVSRSGDRWGAVYSPHEYEEFAQSLDGEYTGVGLRARRGDDGGIEVSRVQKGGPADRAGIRRGDRLHSIDGKRVEDRPVTEVVALLRGDAEQARAGSPVELGLSREGRDWRQTVRRAVLRTSPVTVERPRPEGPVRIKVDSFTKGAGERVREAVLSAPEGAGVLLDLRGNSGGLVVEATRAASAFLDGGLVATYDVDGSQRALHAEPGGDTRRPVVALVDGGTMSAAELLTGALQDRGRAVVVGERTFGKGSVQMPSELPDGSVAELTVGHYRTPAGHRLDNRGITPDLEVGEKAAQRAESVLSGLGGPS
ncbi:S41 family peptidase [Streptomyces physcomitrii]|uniref:PDZ domain-containing protein n=1 Tax=Streptomyces physcomitrii TaxID=2724184 RepID=A0ABX1GUH5_9ACTN|nr:S41 family peptidase [Streptomyces physcomitrii]NKI39710.1 PDZ domain-containing protein [Streptomyces physcomitrii]